MTTEEQRALLAELEANDPAPKPLRPGDLTVKVVVTEMGLGEAAARSWLGKQVKAGRLIIVPAINVETGSRVKAYRKV